MDKNEKKKLEKAELEKQIQENYFPETRAIVKSSETYFSDCKIGAWLKDYFDILPFHENCFHAQGPEKYREYFALNKGNKERIKDANIDEANQEDYFANLKNPCTFHYAFSKDASQRFNIFSWNLQFCLCHYFLDMFLFVSLLGKS